MSKRERLKALIQEAMRRTEAVRGKVGDTARKSYASMLGKGGGGIDEKLRNSLRKFIFGERPGRLRRKRRAGYDRRVTSAKSRAKRAIKNIMDNKAVVPTAIGTTGVLGTAALMSDRRKK